MPYFVDSNVIIGYLFGDADNFGKQSMAVINSGDSNYFGPTVYNECFGVDENGKCNTIAQQITREFRRAIKELNNNLPIENLLTLMKDKKWKTCQILTEIINNHKNNIRLLVDIIRTSQVDFEAECNFKRDEIEKLVQFCDRDLPYKNVRDILEKFIPDQDDVPVILDAHHVGLKVKDLILVSGNYWDITIFKTQICEGTSLTDVIYLKYFVPVKTT